MITRMFAELGFLKILGNLLKKKNAKCYLVRYLMFSVNPHPNTEVSLYASPAFAALTTISGDFDSFQLSGHSNDDPMMKVTEN